MKKIWPLAVLGIVAYIVFALVTLPARLLVSRLAPLITADGVQGTVWDGQAQVVQQGTVWLGSVAWKLRALPLFMGRLRADVKVTRSDGFAQATIDAGFSGNVAFGNLTASLPLASMSAPGGWVGTINAKLPHLSVHNGWPNQVEGTIEITNLTGPANRPSNLGSYKVTFPPGGSGGGELVGALADLGGPLEIAGNIRLKDDRSYVLEGVVAARPDAPKNLSDSLQYLGAPDAKGRRPFSIAGTM